MSLSPFLRVEQACDRVLQWTNGQLTQSGLRTMQTFNLNAARTGIVDCSCPNHGTSECDCQMVILFVYGQSQEPVSLVLHGNHGQTWLSFAETPAAIPNAELAKSIRQLLELQAPHITSS